MGKMSSSASLEIDLPILLVIAKDDVLLRCHVEATLKPPENKACQTRVKSSSKMHFEVHEPLKCLVVVGCTQAEIGGEVPFVEAATILEQIMINGNAKISLIDA